jgi:hypothetical protein
MTDLLALWSLDSLARGLIPLLTAALLGLGLSLTYLLLSPGRREATRLAAALVLLTVIMCLIVRVVNDLASAFIVVGALTLLRLRAAIEDTREFSFLLLAVAVGMGVGEGKYLASVLGAVFVCLLAVVIFPRSARPGPEDQEGEQRVSLSLPTAALAQARAILDPFGAGERGLQVAQVSAERCRIDTRLGAGADWSTVAQALGGVAGVENLEIRVRRRRSAE